MRLQYNARVLRAAVALVAAAACGAATVAAATTTAAPGGRPASPTAHTATTTTAAEPAADPAQPVAAATIAAAAPSPAPVAHDAAADPDPAPVAHAAAASPAPRHRSRTRLRLRLHAVLLHSDLLIGHPVAFAGHLRPGETGRLIGIQQQQGSRWVEVAHVRTGASGRFFARYWPRTLGRLRLRLRLAQRGGWGPALVAPVATVFHEALVSWYGPGGVTACGEVLGPSTLGVANLTLPCGTMVTLRYDGRTLRVPVIDRGPFVPGREYDLTYATKLALGAGDLTVIWASA
jgi:hypothetical protein